MTTRRKAKPASPLAARSRKKQSPVLRMTCQVCKAPRCAWAFGRRGEPRQWYCDKHREIGHQEYFGPYINQR